MRNGVFLYGAMSSHGGYSNRWTRYGLEDMFSGTPCLKRFQSCFI